ncbi:hypothetical protein M885DRAFT_499776 [Pelagophyceae sp. CCMP2097]|nr:hypothetical protein M885DRAFT_499776 [Pelagophyceae sp. CCMP2097]
MILPLFLLLAGSRALLPAGAPLRRLGHRHASPPIIDAEIVGVRGGAEARPASDTAASQREDAALAALFEAVSGTDRGFSTDAEAKRNVVAAIALLLGAAQPREQIQLGGNWTLAWTDAPDITGLQGGPLATVGRIGQEIDAKNIVNVIEWRPSRLATGLGADAADAVEQRVLLAYERTGDAVELKLRGAGLRPRQVLSRRFGGKPLDVTGAIDLPFGRFDILYNDGSVRIAKTGQGFYSINVKRTIGNDADDANGTCP